MSAGWQIGRENRTTRAAVTAVLAAHAVMVAVGLVTILLAVALTGLAPDDMGAVTAGLIVLGLGWSEAGRFQ
jgi:hypothetical protein